MKQPNFLFIFPDQWRGDWLGCYGKLPVRTPNIDRLADNGVLLTEAWTPSPICAPARACLASGTEYDQSPVQKNGESLPCAQDVFYRQLRERGYNVATTGKSDLFKSEMSWGTDGRHQSGSSSKLEMVGFSHGFDCAGKHDAISAYGKGRPEPYFAHLAARRPDLPDIHSNDFRRRQPSETDLGIGVLKCEQDTPPAAFSNLDYSPLPSDAYLDNWVGRRSEELLTDLCGQSNPWFLGINFCGPHEPLDITPEMRKGWENVTFPPPALVENTDPEMTQRVRQNYASMLELLDTWVGRLVETLRRAEALENTIIVFSSDHGEMLGDRNLWNKAGHYQPSVHVPLIISGPVVARPGRRISGPATIMDLAATFLDYAGGNDSFHQSRTLRPVIEGSDSTNRDIAFSGLGNWRAVRDGRYKLVVGIRADRPAAAIQNSVFDPASLRDAVLYDLVEDPLETRDVSAECPDVHRKLVEHLKAALPAGKPTTTDPIEFTPEGGN